MRTVTIAMAVLADSAILFGQEVPVALNAQSPSAVDVPQLVESSLAATKRHWQERVRYTYVTRVENRRRNMDGRLKSQDVEISTTMLIDDAPFERLVERNGQPPSASEERRQTKALNALKRETPAQRTERLQEVVHGREAYVLHITPRPGYQPRGKYGRVYSNVEGTLRIDTQDLVWIKVDGHVIEPFSIGLFLVRLLRGSQVTMEQTRVADVFDASHRQV